MKKFLLSIVLFFILPIISYGQMPVNPYDQLNTHINTDITKYPNRYHFGFPMPYYNFMRPLYKPFDPRSQHNPYSLYNNYSPSPRLHYYTGGYGLYYHWSW